MKRFVRIAFFIPTLFLLSCFSEKDEDVTHQDFNEDHAVLPDKEIPEVDTVKKWISAEAVKISFDSVTVYLDSLEFYLDSTLNSKDTVYIELELGSSLESKHFKVETSVDSCEIIILQQFETSLTVQQEGPHCDLTEWKHYYSEPDTLSQIDSSGVYQFLNIYQDSLRDEFPEVKMKEVFKAIKLHCGKEWYEHAKQATGVKSYPLNVSVSSEIIKILIINRNKEIIQEKVLIFITPMGC